MLGPGASRPEGTASAWGVRSAATPRSSSSSSSSTLTHAWDLGGSVSPAWHGDVGARGSSPGMHQTPVCMPLITSRSPPLPPPCLARCSASSDLIWRTTTGGCCGDQAAIDAGECGCVAGQCRVSCGPPACRGCSGPCLLCTALAIACQGGRWPLPAGLRQWAPLSALAMMRPIASTQQAGASCDPGKGMPQGAASAARPCSLACARTLRW